MMKFEDTKTEVDWKENRLDDEWENDVEIDSKTKFFSILHTIFATFMVSLFRYLFKCDYNDNLLFISAFGCFMILFMISVVNIVRLLKPIEIEYISEPHSFYKMLREHYIGQGVPIKEVNKQLRAYHFTQLQNTYSKISDKRNKFSYLATMCSILAILPYLLCVEIMLTH